MNSENKRLQRYSPVCVGLLIVMSLALISLSIICAGCANKRPILYPLEQDFKLVQAGTPFTPPKDGAYMSKLYICQVMEIDVSSADYCKDVH